MSATIHVSDADFEKTVLKSRIPVVVDFWAPWCGPCRMVAPNLDRIAQEYSGRLVVAKVDTDENQEWAAHYGVVSIPTLLFISNGAVVYEQVGAASYPALKKLADQLLAAPGSVEPAAV